MRSRRPGLIDIHVGARLRGRRRALRMGQQSLGEAVGLTFQQIQKYESGSNRINAAMLLALARALGVPVGYFYEGLPGVEDRHDAASSERVALIDRMMGMPEGPIMAQAFTALSSGRLRQALVNLALSMADDSESIKRP